jgi:hypothetical protein
VTKNRKSSAASPSAAYLAMPTAPAGTGPAPVALGWAANASWLTVSVSPRWRWMPAAPATALAICACCGDSDLSRISETSRRLTVPGARTLSMIVRPTSYLVDCVFLL